MDNIIAIFKAPFAATPDPNVTLKQVAVAYGAAAFLVAVLIKD